MRSSGLLLPNAHVGATISNIDRLSRENLFHVIVLTRSQSHNPICHFTAATWQGVCGKVINKLLAVKLHNTFHGPGVCT